MEIDHIPFETLRDKGFFNIVINRIRKFRQIPVNLMGFFFWKDIDKEIARHQVKRCEEKIETSEQLIEYAAKFNSIKIPIDKPQWEVHYIEGYEENIDIVLMKIHH